MKYILSILIFVSPLAWSGGTATTEGSANTSMSNNGTINGSANQGQKSQKSGSGANQMAGMAFTMLCMMGCNKISEYACYACPLAGMALGQMGADDGAAGESGAVADASKVGDYSVAGMDGSTTYPGSTTGTTDSSGVSTSMTPKDALAALAAKGFTLNPDGSVNTPDNGKVNSDTFSSSGSMAKAGYSAADIKAAQAAIEKVNKDIDAKYGNHAVAVGVDTSGGGGGGGSSTSSGDSAFDAYLKRLRGGGAGVHSAQRMLAGKSINLGGERVGVAGDNIFKMIERHYTDLSVRNEFIRSK